MPTLVELLQALSAAVTAAYVIFTYLIVRANKEIVESLKEAQLPPVAEVEKMLGDVPSALAFHGISADDLKNCDLSAKDFAYLVASFTVGGAYHRIKDPNSKEAFDPTRDTYRYNMCRAPATQRAWPLLKRMMNKTNYQERIERTIKL